MSNEEKAILEKCGIHYENDTLEKEIALRVITETRKQFKEYLEKKRDKWFNAYQEIQDSDYYAVYNTLSEIINELFGE